MKLPSIFNRNQSGFTYIEVLVVMSLFIILAGAVYLIGLETPRVESLRQEAQTLVSVLQKARSQAINNVNQAPHGVRVNNGVYTVFEGATFSPGADFSTGLDFDTGPIQDIVFSQLTGSAIPASITIDDANTNKSITITINHEGRINW